MYKLHLILKYLLKRRIAWVSLVAVTLCTAMVLVVISVMGGWLKMYRDINHGLVGDVIIYRNSLSGFAHYEEMLDAVRKLPEVDAAVAELHTYGLVNIYDQIQTGVQIVAYSDLEQASKVNTFQQSLYRQYSKPLEDIQNDKTLSRAEKEKRIAALKATPPTFNKPLSADEYKNEMPASKIDVSNWPGIIVGNHLIMHRDENGKDNRPTVEYRAWVKLTPLAMGNGGTFDASHLPTRTYWIVDDSTTKFYPVDSTTVYVPFAKLQSDLGMTAEDYTETVGDLDVPRQIPARVNQIQIKLKDGVDLYKGTAAVAKVIDGFRNKYTLGNAIDPLKVESWDQKQAKFLGAVENEEVLLMFLFGIISVVAIFLVFCIFYMIVVEKTRDIGIIKAVGATSEGIAAIFLGYGLTIGILGAALGLLTGYLIVHNINELHAWLGRVMHVKIWDPETYLYDTIPNTMNPHDVVWIVSIAILSAVLGAIIPAMRAARLNPVEALRWE